tara:strand:- start:1162 stop:1518 length:357 start_codon:yes stop_codon:yes gene_type:complete
MAILHINSNIPQDDTSFAEFSEKVTQLLSDELQKNNSFIQVIYTRSQILFGSQSGPSSLVTLSSSGIRQYQIDSLIGPLSKLLERLIGSPPPTTYIRFEDIDRAKTAWNGRSFKKIIS